ncbi:homoserine kinase [Clostridiales bacterium]|nr:homoserine kinase [Clostridiales bacterium]
MLHIRIPATSANMGPGFDCAGIALQLYNDIWIEKIESGFEIVSKNGDKIPMGDDNLIYKTIKCFYEEEGLKIPSLRLIQSDNIPMTRGLGSSAACIVGGLLAANELSGRNYSKDEIAQRAARLEGHPDNSNPAIFGGMIISAIHDGGMKYVKLSIPESLRFAVMIPGFSLSTAEARKALPDLYKRGDAVFNASRVGLLVASMMTGNIDNLRIAMEDAVHQPYRKKLIKGYDQIFEGARKNGSKAEYLSGAGPTLMAVVLDKNADEFENNMKEMLKNIEGEWELKMLRPAMVGAVIEKE